MDEIRTTLAPLTDWIPEDLRKLLDVEVWWLIFLTLTLAILLLFALLSRASIRALFSRKKMPLDWDRNLRENLDDCPLPVRPPGEHRLAIYHVTVRLRLVVVAPAGKEVDIDATAVEKLLDRVVPGLGAVALNDRPAIRIWPAQLSQQGFMAAFHRCTPRPEKEGEASRWVLVAGKAVAGRQPVLLGLGLWAVEPNMIGRVNLEPRQWLDVLRLKDPETG